MKANESKLLWGIEYSQKQDAFNIDTLQNILTKNLDTLKIKVLNDYKILGIANSYEEASKIVYLMQDIKKENVFI